MLYQDDVSGSVLFAMRHIKSRKMANYLMQNYRKFDHKILDNVVRAIGAMAVSNDTKAKKFLLEILSNKKEKDSVRRSAVQTLAEVRVEEAIPAFWDFFYENKNYKNSEAAVVALSMLGDEQVLKRFIGLLKSTNEIFKSLAIVGLSRMERSEAIPALIQMLKDENPKIRIQVLGILYIFRDHRVEKAKIELLDDSDLNVRRKPISVLLSSKTSDASRKLTKLLEDGEEDIRLEAIWVLRELGMKGVPGSVYGLVAGLRNDKVVVRNSAFDLLKKTGRIHRRSEPVLIETYRKGDDKLKGRIIELLAHYRTSGAVLELERIAREETGDLKTHALGVLKKMKDIEGGLHLHCLHNG